MYKAKLIGLVLVIAMLAGCSTQESVSQPVQTEPPIDLPYEIIRDDDGYYLLLEDSNATDNEVEGSLQVWRIIEFGSMDEMVQDIKTGNFTEKELQTLSRFRKDEDGRTILCDLSKLYDVYTPEEFDEKKIMWTGKSYRFELLSTGSDVEVCMSNFISDSSKEKAIENLISCDSVVNFTLLSTEQIEDRNATVIIYTSETYYGVMEHKRVYYTIRDENKEVFVCEDYYNTSNIETPFVSSGDTSYVYIYGTENGMNYKVTLENPQERPSVEYLMGFGFREYVETEAA